jgi:hypothetical protein
MEANHIVIAGFLPGKELTFVSNASLALLNSRHTLRLAGVTCRMAKRWTATCNDFAAI